MTQTLLPRPAPASAATPITTLTRYFGAHATVADEISLDYQARQKCRQRVSSATGKPFGIVLPRGDTLRHGDLLCADDGRILRVIAAPEKLSVVHCPDGESLARAAFHLGNRHAIIQIAEDCICYPHDSVLDALLVSFDLTVEVTLAPFDAEPGAYHRHGNGLRGHAHGSEHGLSVP